MNTNVRKILNERNRIETASVSITIVDNRYCITYNILDPRPRNEKQRRSHYIDDVYEVALLCRIFDVSTPSTAIPDIQITPQLEVMLGLNGNPIVTINRTTGLEIMDLIHNRTDEDRVVSMLDKINELLENMGTYRDSNAFKRLIEEFVTSVPNISSDIREQLKTELLYELERGTVRFDTEFAHKLLHNSHHGQLRSAIESSRNIVNTAPESTLDLVLPQTRSASNGLGLVRRTFDNSYMSAAFISDINGHEVSYLNAPVQYFRNIDDMLFKTEHNMRFLMKYALDAGVHVHKTTDITASESYSNFISITLLRMLVNNTPAKFISQISDVIACVSDQNFAYSVFSELIKPNAVYGRTMYGKLTYTDIELRDVIARMGSRFSILNDVDAAALIRMIFIAEFRHFINIETIIDVKVINTTSLEYIDSIDKLLAVLRFSKLNDIITGYLGTLDKIAQEKPNNGQVMMQGFIKEQMSKMRRILVSSFVTPNAFQKDLETVRILIATMELGIKNEILRNKANILENKAIKELAEIGLLKISSIFDPSIVSNAVNFNITLEESNIAIANIHTAIFGSKVIQMEDVKSYAENYNCLAFKDAHGNFGNCCVLERFNTKIKNTTFRIMQSHNSRTGNNVVYDHINVASYEPTTTVVNNLLEAYAPLVSSELSENACEFAYSLGNMMDGVVYEAHLDDEAFAGYPAFTKGNLLLASYQNGDFQIRHAVNPITNVLDIDSDTNESITYNIMLTQSLASNSSVVYYDINFKSNVSNVIKNVGYESLLVVKGRMIEDSYMTTDPMEYLWLEFLDTVEGKKIGSGNRYEVSMIPNGISVMDDIVCPNGRNYGNKINHHFRINVSIGKSVIAVPMTLGDYSSTLLVDDVRIFHNPLINFLINRNVSRIQFFRRHLENTLATSNVNNANFQKSLDRQWGLWLMDKFGKSISQTMLFRKQNADIINFSVRLLNNLVGQNILPFKGPFIKYMENYVGMQLIHYYGILFNITDIGTTTLINDLFTNLLDEFYNKSFFGTTS